MSETVINDTGLSAAEAAVLYALELCVCDPDFRSYMVGTETLWRCLVAEAERRGRPVEEIKRRLFKAIEERGERRAPRVNTLEAQLDEVRDWLRERMLFGVFQGVEHADVVRLREIVE